MGFNGQEDANQIEKNLLFYVDKELEKIYTYFKDNIKTSTLFVGDHTRLLKESDLDEYSVPFIMVTTDGSVASQYLPNLDIAPTILDFLQGKASWFQGSTLLENSKKHKSRYSFRNGNLEVAYKQYLIVGSVYNLSEQKCFNYGSNNFVHPIAIPCTAELTQFLVILVL